MSVPPAPCRRTRPQAAPPSFNNGVVNAIRGSGSDTTFFVMQKLGDLYTGAGLYGCTLNPDSSNDVLYNSSFVDSSLNEQYYCEANKNQTTTDTADNWNRTEVSQGVDDVGSGAGQNQLCASLDTPLPVDFARSSKPVTVAASCNEVATGFAKDSVPVVDYPVNPSTYGTAAAGSIYSSINGGSVGPVTSGWLPGDPVNGSANSGTALSDISDIDNGGLTNSTAYRLWCASGGNQITDWGSLTNLGPNMKEAPVTVSSGVGTISGTFPTGVSGGTSSGIAVGDAVTDSLGYLLGRHDGLRGLGQLGDLVASADQLQHLGHPDLRHRRKGARGPGSTGGDPDAHHGCEPELGHGVHLRQLRLERGVGWGVRLEHGPEQGLSDPNPATATGDNASPHVALENNASQIDRLRGRLTGPATTPTRPSRWRRRCTSCRTASTAPSLLRIGLDRWQHRSVGTKLTENGQLPSTTKC